MSSANPANAENLLNPDGRTAGRSLPGQGSLAIAFVVLAVVALFVVPQVVGRRAARAQREVAEVLDPASLLATRLSALQAREMALFQAFLMTGEQTYEDQYNRVRDQERDLYAELRAKTAGLDLLGGVREQVLTLSADAESWHLMQHTAFKSDEDRQAAVQQLDAEQARYEEVQSGVLDLETAIQDEADDARARVDGLQTLQGWITLALVLLALGATVVLVRVGWDLRTLAGEAQDRRHDAVRARREIDALMEATGDGVIGMDLEGRCTSVNRAGCELLGYMEGGLKGRDVHEVLHHKTLDGRKRSRKESPLLSALREGKSVRSADVDVLWRKDGTPLPVQWSLRPMVDGTELKGAVLTFTDMTEIREKEEALRRAVRAREEVVSIVSHDLRNPLGVVGGAADLLLDLPLEEPERRKQADIIKRSAQRMSRLIGDLLDISRIEAGALVVRPAHEEVEDVLEEARAIFASQAETRGVTLAVEVEPDLPEVVLDRDRVLQALANLLDNALKVTPEGGRVTLGADASDADAVGLYVKDTGPGIPADAMDRLFDRFWQASRHDRTGSGLGLAIVRGIAEAHGGTVRVASERGQGALFRIVLPLDPRDRVGSAIGTVPEGAVAEDTESSA